jgi:hypothetical protein
LCRFELSAVAAVVDLAAHMQRQQAVVVEVVEAAVLSTKSGQCLCRLLAALL